MYQPKRNTYQRTARGASIDGFAPMPTRGTSARLAYRDQYIRATESRGVRHPWTPKTSDRGGMVKARSSTFGITEVPASQPQPQTSVQEHTPPHLPTPVPEPEVSELSFTLPAYEAPSRPKLPVRRRGSFKKVAVRTASFLLAVFMFGGALLTWQGYSRVNQVFHGQTTVAALSEKPVAPELLKGEGDGRINVLLLGVGGDGHDGGDLTDTIMVLSVDPVNHRATMVSVPRDLWVKSPAKTGGSYQKINAIFEEGKAVYKKQHPYALSPEVTDAGLTAIDSTVGTVLGVKIDYHLLTNFKGFAEAIDAVKGVTVTVDSTLNDPMLAWENGNNAQVAVAGSQTMNGKQALLYARSRYTTSDFSRNERQREILVALKNKVTTMRSLSDPTRLTTLMNSFSNNMYSDLSPKGAVRLLNIVRGIGSEHITAVDLADKAKPLVKPVVVEGVSTVQPVAGPTNYADIQDAVRTKIPDGYIAKERASVYVLAKTAQGAKDTADKLANYGYNITGYVQKDTLPQESAMIDMSDKSAPYTAHYLGGRYTEVSRDKLPSGVVIPTGTKFVIMIAK